MSITVNILYTGKNGNAKKFAEEMVANNIVTRIKAQTGNERYEYFFPMDDPESVLLIDRWTDQGAIDDHHKSDMMGEIADLRKKYQLKMKVTRLTDLN